MSQTGEQNANYRSEAIFSLVYFALYLGYLFLYLELGFVYERSDKNLVASVLVHALIDTLPAMTLITFGGG